MIAFEEGGLEGAESPARTVSLEQGIPINANANHAIQTFPGRRHDRQAVFRFAIGMVKLISRSKNILQY
jgi:hypothetical protein